MAQTLMVLGTASEVGKSFVVTGLCRYFARLGLRVAPFKAQNMSNNAYVCLDGGEIGWAQALQARACGLEPTVDMNPILLKPMADHLAQVVVHGQVQGTVAAFQFDREVLREKIRDSFLRLNHQYDLLVLEGAGGAAEINLKDRDLVNFAMAEMADAPVILVADIDRGGVFASLVGTMELLTPEERPRVKGFIINKFRGDLHLLEPGLQMLEERTQRPVLGVLPYLADVQLEAEDSVSLETYRRQQLPFSPATVNIAVVVLPHIANFTDFLPLAHIEGVRLNYVHHADEILNADVVILPGSKNTIADLRWLKARNWPDALARLHIEEKEIVGVCGGYQMLGEEVADSLGVEGPPSKENGLHVLPLSTELAAHKTTRQVEALWHVGERSGLLRGYEIHMGRSLTHTANASRFFVRTHVHKDWQPEGAISKNGRTWGTYLHGLFENGAFLQEWLAQVGARRGVTVRVPWPQWTEQRARHFDRLADVLSEHVDMTTIRSFLSER
jgi:adenosylcobyric acid synthase